LEARISAFFDDFPLELGQCPEDMEDELPAGGRGVDGLLQAPEADPAFAQVGDGGDEMLECSAKPVSPLTRR
jgi:hypothetical protein